jgi:hypothetical protein
MTQEIFKQQIELFVDRYQEKMRTAKTKAEKDAIFEDLILIKGTISRTLRLCFQYPDLAKEYMENQPKATMD